LGRFILSSFFERLVRFKFPVSSVCVWIETIEFTLLCSDNIVDSFQS
jgi:hypothetical protein